MEKDLKWIKKHYGEQMMHLCRGLFPNILESEGLLPNLLKEHFPSNNHHLAMDIKENGLEDAFKNYIYSLLDVEDGIEVKVQKSAVELMDQAGYILYPECKTEQDVQSFKHWWKKGEELCTFKGGRLNSCRVLFSVKKNAEELKRENFTSPSRQDEYGTSVISIQFTKNENQYLSIKNRYNHSVNNPDNTFYSNLDNIIPGLSDAFERDYGVMDRSNRDKIYFELTNYVCIDGKYYHYNKELNNTYYCDDGVIIDNFKVKKLPDHQMLLDIFIADFNKKTITIYDKGLNDSFIESLVKIKQMSFKDGVLKIFSENGNKIEIGVSETNEIVSYKNEQLQKVNKNFMFWNTSLEELDMPRLKSMGDNCFNRNEKMVKLNVPSLQSMGDCCFFYNNEMTELDLPNLQEMGCFCFYSNKDMAEFNAPRLKSMSFDCFNRNEKMVKLNAPSLQSMGDCCFSYNKEMRELNLPSLQKICGDCFCYNEKMRELSLPRIKSMGRGCFEVNRQFYDLGYKLKGQQFM